MPAPAQLWRHSVAMAIVEALLTGEDWLRRYRYDPAWAPGQAMASYDNGSGDRYFIVFCRAGVFLKGFDHESPMSPWRTSTPTLWPGMFDGISAELAEHATEPAFMPEEETTFCLWWTPARGWQCGVREFAVDSDPDGSEWMLRVLAGGPEQYAEDVQRYHETGVSAADIAQIYQHASLEPELVSRLVRNGGGPPSRAWLRDAHYGEPYPFA